ncbi:MAG: hypothetical protein AABW61_00695 [Candidatus Aenigmatarchaeota archaeon]
MSNLLLTFSVVFIILSAGCAAPSQTSETGVEPTGVKHEIEMASSGFSPRLSNIKLGDTAVFVNKDAAPHWPASDIHPIHGVYPEKGGCIGSKFDACKGLKQNEKYEFTFFHGGSWCFHDHLNPSLVGCVDVQ